MKARRVSKLSLCLATVYLLWSVLVYFGSGTLRGDAHSWWPMFLYPLIWPLGPVFKSFETALFNWLIPNPRLAPDSVFILNDHILGAFYIVAGTIWFWLIGWLIPFASARLFPSNEGD